MYRDEIVDEVRAVRERLLREAGGTLEGLVAKLRELEKKETEPLLQPPPAPADQPKVDVA